MLKRFSASSIRTKLAIVMTLLIGLISIVIYSYFPERLRGQALAAIVDEAYNITDMAAFAVAPGLLSGDRQRVHEALWTLRENNDLAYVVVLNERRQLFAADNSKLAERYHFESISSAPVSAPARRGKAIRTTVAFSPDGDLLQTRTPILDQGKPIGYLYVGLALNQVKTEIARSRRTIALVSLCIFIIGVVGSFLL